MQKCKYRTKIYKILKEDSALAISLTVIIKIWNCTKITYEQLLSIFDVTIFNSTSFVRISALTREINFSTQTKSLDSSINFDNSLASILTFRYVGAGATIVLLN